MNTERVVCIQREEHEYRESIINTESGINTDIAI
jgi:hypothetical protein